MQIVVDSQTQQLDLESIGIKGAALRHLRSLRFYVPKFHVLTSRFFESFCQQTGFTQKAQFAMENISETAELAREFERLLGDVELPQDLNQELSDALRDLEGQGSLRVVVRPSRPYMSKLDSSRHLNLTSREHVTHALFSVFREHFSFDALEERASKDLPVLHLKLPIILQTFVKPDVTGIIMPYRNEADFYYITAWKGFGFELDFHTCDHYLVNYRDLMLEKFLNNTSGDVVFFEESSNSITRTTILHEEAKEPFLDHDQIIEMCKLYAENASELGGLAIEFKIHGEDVSFIALKDAGLIEKAEQALEDLRQGIVEKTEEPVPEASAPPSMDQAAEPEPAGSSVEPIPAAHPADTSRSEQADAPSEAAPADPPVAAVAEVNRPEEPRSEPAVEDAPAVPSEPTPSTTPTSAAPEAALRTEEPKTYADVDNREHAVPELSHGSDEHLATVSRIVAKYIEINPDLARQLKLLEQDLLDALRR